MNLPLPGLHDIPDDATIVRAPSYAVGPFALAWPCGSERYLTGDELNALLAALRSANRQQLADRLAAAAQIV